MYTKTFMHFAESIHQSDIIYEKNQQSLSTQPLRPQPTLKQSGKRRFMIMFSVLSGVGKREEPPQICSREKVTCKEMLFLLDDFYASFT